MGIRAVHKRKRDELKRVKKSFASSIMSMKRKTNMKDNARELKNAYLREWRKKNKDKVKEHNRRYWEKKASQLEGETDGRLHQNVQKNKGVLGVE